MCVTVLLFFIHQNCLRHYYAFNTSQKWWIIILISACVTSYYFVSAIVVTLWENDETKRTAGTRREKQQVSAVRDRCSLVESSPLYGNLTADCAYYTARDSCPDIEPFTALECGSIVGPLKKVDHCFLPTMSPVRQCKKVFILWLKKCFCTEKCHLVFAIC